MEELSVKNPSSASGESGSLEGSNTAATELSRRPRFSLAGLLLGIAFLATLFAFLLTLSRLQKAQRELDELRLETGFLAASAPDDIAAVRIPSDAPMTFRLRVRVPPASSGGAAPSSLSVAGDGPSASPRYRLVYSSVWERGQSAPTWFAGIDVPPGESVVVLRILKDPRDDRWKITTLRRNTSGTRRIATALADEHVQLFKGSHEWLSAGIKQETQTVKAGRSLRLLDERILAGEGALMLFGDRPPDTDMVGVYAELQPDIGPL